MWETKSRLLSSLAPKLILQNFLRKYISTMYNLKPYRMRL